MEFRLPELGEGIETATVVNVLVQPGAAVSANQDVIEVETDKASVPVPVPSAGTVEAVLVKPGDKIKVGQPILKLSGESAAKPKPQPAPAAAKKESAPPPEKPPRPPAHGNGDASTAAKRIEFALPNLGEGIESATVVSVAVQPGSAIAPDQPLLEVETDKATMPLPAPGKGRVVEVRVRPGDKVKAGDVVAVLELEAVAAPPAPKQPAAKAAAPSRLPPTKKPAAREEKLAPAPSGEPTPVPAGPATRRLARELGVDLQQVSGSARGGRVTIDDVKAFVHGRLKHAPAAAGTVGEAFALPPLPDFAKYGEVERKPVSKLRETIARNLTLAWRACPMVTQYDLADVTDLEAGRKRSTENLPKGAPKITMTVLAVKAVVAALKEFPHFNASFDAAAGELVYKKYYHVGIAVDTERGLVVPVVRDADRKGIRELGKAVADLAERARANKLALDEMRGGTFTITNLGGIGGTAFSPIVNYPEVAILGMARSSLQPVVRDGQVQVRLMLPLCLTYDHRVIDGADGARFTSKLAQLFSDPIRLLMES